MKPLPLLLSLGGLVLFNACTLPTARIMARHNFYSVSGDAVVNDGMTTGSLDVEEAGIDDDDRPALRADVDFGPFRAIGSIDEPRFGGMGMVTAEISDGMGNTIPLGSDVDADYDLSLYSGVLAFDIIPGDTFDIGAGIGVTWFDLAQTYVQTSGVGAGTTVFVEEDFPLPVLAVTASIELGLIQLNGLATGLQVEYDDDSVFFFSADVFARIKLFGGSNRIRGSLVGGYRFNELDVEYDDDGTNVDVDLLITAPYVGLEVSI